MGDDVISLANNVIDIIKRFLRYSKLDQKLTFVIDI